MLAKVDGVVAKVNNYLYSWPSPVKVRRHPRQLVALRVESKVAKLDYRLLTDAPYFVEPPRLHRVPNSLPLFSGLDRPQVVFKGETLV